LYYDDSASGSHYSSTVVVEVAAVTRFIIYGNLFILLRFTRVSGV